MSVKQFLKSPPGIVLEVVTALIIIITFVADEKILRRDVKELKQDVDKIYEITLRNEGTLKALAVLLSKETKLPDITLQKLIFREIKELKNYLGFHVITGTHYGSKKRAFLLNQYGEKKEYLPFKGESLNASWSPDMSKILFQGIERGKKNFGIYVYDLRKSEIQTITRYENNIDPIWTPDGTEILFCSNRYKHDKKSERAYLIQAYKKEEKEDIYKKDKKRDTYDLFIMNSDGSDIRLLVKSNKLDKNNPNLSICLPAVSPNNECITFSTGNNNNWDLWIFFRSDLSVIERMVGWGYCRIKFNPLNNGEVVFVKDRRELEKVPQKDAVDIIVATLKINHKKNNNPFKNLDNLTKKSFRETYPYCASDNFPDWSYDGKRIIFSSTDVKRARLHDEKWLIHIVNKDGTGRMKLSGKEIKAIYPDW